MPTQSFTSFEAFFDANRHASIRAMVLSPAREDWVLTNLVLNNLSIQLGQAEAKAVVEGTPRAGGVTIFLPTLTSSAWTWNGRRFDEHSLLVARPGDDFCLAADTPRRWCSVYFPDAMLAGESGDTASVIVPRRGFFQMPRQQIERFRLVIAQLEKIVKGVPAALESTAGQKAAAQKLKREIVNLLAAPQEVEPTHGRHPVPRSEIIRRALNFIEQRDGEYILLEQVASATAVSQRTLRDAFQSYFGVPPVQYLNRRMLHQVRKALIAADPTVTTVTEIATKFGFWQFGRLARDYRFLFGELPSETLRSRY